MNQSRTLWESIGNTPLLKIRSLSEATGCEIFGKAEFLNPGGSIKDRTAKGIVQSAEALGLIKPGDTLVEGTAGNTGIALAMIAKERGYKCVISMPNNQAPEKKALLLALGADVRDVPPVPFSSMDHFYHRARLISENEGGYWVNQFENTFNFDVHFATTGPEIFEQCQQNLDWFVCAAGTGGSLAGISAYLKSQSNSVRCALVDPLGSGLYQYFNTGEMKAEGSSVTEGIGIMRLTENFKRAQLDDAFQFNDQEMISMLYHVAQKDGLIVGSSAALNLRAAFELGMRYKGQNKKIVTLLCDHGSRYQSRLFNEEWLASKGLSSHIGLSF